MSRRWLPVRLTGRYLRTVGRILFQPGTFFSSMDRDGGLTLPLLFALVNHWLASALSFIWKAPLSEMLSRFAREGASIWSDFSSELSTIDSPGRFAEEGIPVEVWSGLRERLVPWLWGASSVLLDPILTLPSILGGTLLVFVAARVLMDSEEPIRFSSVLRVVCFASAATLWNVIPVAGALIAPIAVVTTTAIGLATSYGSGFGRALIVALFPKLAFIGALAGGLAVMGWIAFRLFAALVGLQ